MLKKILKTKGEKGFKYEYRITFVGNLEECESIKSIIKKSHCDIVDTRCYINIFSQKTRH